ncbi:MAG: GNAT family N-acetyltransferase, partial [Candidatus Scalinduaceae bacterium]
EKFSVSMVNRKKTMYYLKHIWLKARYSSFFHLIFDGLGRIGIRINPYYVVLEGLFNGSLPHLETGFDEYDIGFLRPQDMRAISAIPGRNISEEKLLLRLKEGKKCFGIKYRGKLVAFSWCDLNEYTIGRHRFSLKENEAYLVDAYTLIPFRGKGIAPYIRYQLYKELAKSGRNKLYSISECVNTPSIRFKKKLNAKVIELDLYVRLFKKWHFNSRLRRYRVEI